MTARKEGNVLRVQVTGERTRQAVEGVAKEIMEACAKAGARKLLVDVREFRGNLPLIDNYEVPSKEFPKLPHTELLEASAVVDNPANDKRFAFFEDVARGHGYNLRIFGSLESAIKWLAAQTERAS